MFLHNEVNVSVLIAIENEIFTYIKQVNLKVLLFNRPMHLL